MLWKALADAGVFGLAIAEEYGGSGGSLQDLAVFYAEAGRALCPTTVHSSVHAALAIDQLGSPDNKATWLPRLASGAIRGTTALCSARDAAVVAPVLRADSAPTHWRLNGTADYVADADVADLLVVSAATRERTLVFVVDAHTTGLSMEPLEMAGGHRAFTVQFDDVTVTADAVIGDEQAGRYALEDHHEGTSVGLTGGQVAQHPDKSTRHARGSRWPPARG
ncbi:MAG: hypothetical protein B7W97_02110 [Mycobacterium sp. 20-66-4]|nr:MAG: hypothetical protein B7W97_02110 [Mycobacterium sp. 20-66-4]